MAAADNPYYIKPADAMQALMSGYQGYDRSQAAAKQAELQSGRQDAMAALQGGGDLRSPLAKLIGIGDVEGAKAIGEYAHQTAQAQHQTAQLAEQGRHNKVTEDLTAQAHREGKIPFGWTVSNGQAAFIPKGPADPEYIQTATESKAKPKEFSVTDVTKLSEEGAKFANIGEFKDTFEPRFAGYKGEAIGNAATFMGRNFPSMTSKDTVDAAQWWQGYDRFKNVVRNELFGAALTATEKAAFERADINPGMDPKTIEVNIARQHEIAQNGLKRKANALIQSGYDPKAIAAAYGVKLDDIGVFATPTRKGQDRGGQSVPAAAAPSPSPAAAQQPSAAKVPQRGEVRDGYRFKGGNPGDQENWVKVQ